MVEEDPEAVAVELDEGEDDAVAVAVAEEEELGVPDELGLALCVVDPEVDAD